MAGPCSLITQDTSMDNPLRQVDLVSEEIITRINTASRTHMNLRFPAASWGRQGCDRVKQPLTPFSDTACGGCSMTYDSHTLLATPQVDHTVNAAVLSSCGA